MTKYIANYRSRIAHALAVDAPPNVTVLCGAPISPRKWYYVERSEIRDFIRPDEKRPKNTYRLCAFCRRKLDIEE